MINRNQLYTNQTSSRWKKVNKMRHFTVIADLNVAQNKDSLMSYLSFSLFLFHYMIALQLLKTVVLRMGFVILTICFRLKTTIFYIKI